MTSDDTHQRTLQLLEGHAYFGATPEQVTLIKQEKVACLAGGWVGGGRTRAFIIQGPVRSSRQLHLSWADGARTQHRPCACTCCSPPSPCCLQTTTPIWRCCRETPSRCRPSRTATAMSTCCCTPQVRRSSGVQAWGDPTAMLDRGAMPASPAWPPVQSAQPSAVHFALAACLPACLVCPACPALVLLQGWPTAGWLLASSGFASSRTQTGWFSAPCPPPSVSERHGCCWT